MSCNLETYQMACVLHNNLMQEDEYVFEEDITGWKFYLDFRTSFSSRIEFRFTTDDGGFVTTDAVAGKVVRIAKKMTYIPSTYYADLTIEKPGQDPITLIRQSVTISNSYNNE